MNHPTLGRIAGQDWILLPSTKSGFKPTQIQSFFLKKAFLFNLLCPGLT